MLNQFLYGEVTGVQIGHWLYAAPDLESARFLARQAVEELQHVDNFLNIMRMLNVQPTNAHRAVRFLATGMMGGGWAEHVAMEMAAGEGFVLMAFYAMIDTIDHTEVVEIMKRAVRQEERHVEFGESQTMKLVADNPSLKRQLLGLSLTWMWGVRQIGRYMRTRLPSEHAVLRHVDAFLELTLRCNELRLQRMGLLDHPLRDLSTVQRAALVAEAYAAKLATSVPKIAQSQARLTDHYLDDPAVRALIPPRS
jgi:bacterioferritin (cytochrome b1)